MYERAELIVLEKRLEPSTPGRAGAARGRAVEAREAPPAEVLQLSDVLNGSRGRGSVEAVLLSQRYRCVLCSRQARRSAALGGRMRGFQAAARRAGIGRSAFSSSSSKTVTPGAFGTGSCPPPGATVPRRACCRRSRSCWRRRAIDGYSGRSSPGTSPLVGCTRSGASGTVRTVEIRCFCSVVGVSKRACVREKQGAPVPDDVPVSSPRQPRLGGVDGLPVDERGPRAPCVTA